MSTLEEERQANKSLLVRTNLLAGPADEMPGSRIAWYVMSRTRRAAFDWMYHGEKRISPVLPIDNLSDFVLSTCRSLFSEASKVNHPGMSQLEFVEGFYGRGWNYSLRHLTVFDVMSDSLDALTTCFLGGEQIFDELEWIRFHAARLDAIAPYATRSYQDDQYRKPSRSRHHDPFRFVHGSMRQNRIPTSNRFILANETKEIFLP